MYNAIDFRYDAFTQTFAPYGYGYSGNPKEVHTIPLVAPYEVHLNEIPRGDSPSTLLVNQQGGGSFTEVSFATSPAASQFRAIYGLDITPPVSIVGQGTVQFNIADAGKIMEFSYYGLGAILQNQFFNKLVAGEFGVPDRVSRAVNYVGNDLLFTEPIDIGVWDMVATASITVPIAPISYLDIRMIYVVILNDVIDRFDLSYLGNGGVSKISGGGIELTRTTAGQFDSIAFDSVLQTRGYMTIVYKE